MKIIALQKVSLSDTQNPKSVCYTLTVNDKHFLLNRDNLTQTIQIILSQKRKTFFQFFLAFLKSILHFKYFPKNDDPHSSCISGYTSSKKYG